MVGVDGVHCQLYKMVSLVEFDKYSHNGSFVFHNGNKSVFERYENH